MFKTTPIVWAKDEEGHRHLCPYNELSDPNVVRADEASKCLHDDSELETRKFVPSNNPEGRIKFAKSVSLN